MGTLGVARKCFYTSLNWSDGKPTVAKTRNVSSEDGHWEILNVSDPNQVLNSGFKQTPLKQLQN
jgi:hypothetical protein